MISNQVPVLNDTHYNELNVDWLDGQEYVISYG